MPRDFDNDDDFYPHTIREVEFDDDDDFDSDWHDEDSTDDLFDEDGEVSDRGHAVLAEMDRNGLFL
jgi:hypothetical protein